MLDHLAQRLSTPPVFDMQAELLRGANMLSGIMENFSRKVRNVLDSHRTMNADAFADFFTSMGDLKDQMRKTAADIRTEVEKASAVLAALEERDTGGAGDRPGAFQSQHVTI